MLSEHVQHGDIWTSKDNNTVFILFVPGNHPGILLVNAEGKSQRVDGTVTLTDSPFDPTAEGAELKWRAPAPNNNNFNMTGDDARVLSTAIMVLSREQTARNQGILDGLQAISQAQPPTPPPTQG
jgi:hypothetical protein